MPQGSRVALVTPSYAGDFERCKLLCDSVDQFIEDRPDHFILVENQDYELFCQLSGAKRHVINELDILPSWLHSFRAGISRNARKIWVSNRTWPMRGWHVQQLRRIAIAGFVSHEAMLYCDSDMFFVKPFSTSKLWKNDALRLYRKDYGIHDGLPDQGKMHRSWTVQAAKLNGLPKPEFPAHDYINNLVSWKRETVTGMCQSIEQRTGKHWIAALGSKRTFSECQVYGAYADGVLNGEGHWHGSGALCQTYWSGAALTAETVTDFVGTLTPDQVAIGVQSFTGTNPELLRKLIAV